MQRRVKGLLLLTAVVSTVGFSGLAIEKASAADFRRRVDRDVRREFNNDVRFRRDIDRDFRRNNNDFERRVRREVRRDFDNGNDFRRRFERRVERDNGFRGFKVF